MKILYIHQYFKTPDQPGGTRSYWIAKELIKNGHEVIMLTSNKSINGKKEVQLIDGIKVIYLNVIYNSGSMGFIKRAIAFSKFVIKATPEALKLKGLDLVIATSTPLTVGIIALARKWFQGTPFVFEVRDLWPEVPIQMGALKNPIFKKLSLWLEKIIYTNSIHIIALSPGMQQGVIDRINNPKKVSMIPNMSKIDKFWPRTHKDDLYINYQIKPRSFKVVYFGALGIANAVNYILDAARILKDNEDIEFIFLGSGGTELELKTRVSDENLKQVKFLGTLPMEELSEVINLCQVSLVTFANLPILATNSPNKLFDSLSAGLPIIVNSPGWTKNLVEEHNCGIYVNYNNPEQLSNAILKLKSNLILREQMAKNSRILAETKYDKSILCSKFVQVVESLEINT